MTIEQFKLKESKLKMIGHTVFNLGEKVLVSYKKTASKNIYSDLRIIGLNGQEELDTRQHTDIVVGKDDYGYTVSIEEDRQERVFANIDSFGNIYVMYNTVLPFKETSDCIVVCDLKFVYYFNKKTGQKSKFKHSGNVSGKIEIYGKSMFIGTTFMSITNGMYVTFDSISGHDQYIECSFDSEKSIIELLKDGKVYQRREIHDRRSYYGSKIISSLILDKKSGRLFNIEDCQKDADWHLYGIMSDLLTRKIVEFKY